MAVLAVSAHGRINQRLRRIDPTCIKILISAGKDKAYVLFVAAFRKKAANDAKSVLLLQVEKHLIGAQACWRKASALGAGSQTRAAAGFALLVLKKKVYDLLVWRSAGEIAAFVRCATIHTHRILADVLNIKFLKEQVNFDYATSESKEGNALAAGFISQTDGRCLLATNALFEVAVRQKRSGGKSSPNMAASVLAAMSPGFTF